MPRQTSLFKCAHCRKPQYESGRTICTDCQELFTKRIREAAAEAKRKREEGMATSVPTGHGDPDYMPRIYRMTRHDGKPWK